jgi:hypothetical protein
MYRWLAYGGQGATPGDNFSRREFSFTLANDIYIRFERASLLPSETGIRKIAILTGAGGRFNSSSSSSSLPVPPVLAQATP